MTRDVESQLLDFCLKQRDRFNLSEWLEYPASSDDKATVALYLANSSRFGHRDELFKVADHLHRGCVGKFAEMARLTDFDPSRFRGRLSARLAHEQGVS
jgi:hypothetical protein